MKFLVTDADQTLSIEVRRHPEGGWWVTEPDSEPVHWPGQLLPDGDLVIEHPTGRMVWGTAVQDATVYVQQAGAPYTAQVIDARKAALHLGHGAGVGMVTTPMPGVVVRVLVQEGDQVSEGDVLVVVEAMKMENDFKSPISGVVAQVAVQTGDALESNALLVHVQEPT